MRVLVAICLFLASSLAFAGTQSGTVAWIIVRSTDGLTYFHLSGGKSGSPSCATGSYWIIRDENSTAGKHQLALLLSAQASGKKVNVVGRNSCARWGDGEDVDTVQVTNE
jgi:hypothetical protein